MWVHCLAGNPDGDSYVEAGQVSLSPTPNREGECSSAGHIQGRVGDPPQSSINKDPPRDVLLPCLGRALLPRNSLGNSRRNGQLEEFVLIRLNHEKYPEHEAHQADQH